jgi:hypothetical protein
VIIVLSLLAGIFLLMFTAVLFYRFSWGIIHIAILFAGLFIINFIPGDDSLYLIISFIITGASAGYSFRKKKNLLFFILITSLSISFIFTFNHYFLKNYKNMDILQNSKNGILSLLEGNEVTESEKKEIIRKVDDSLEIIVQIIPFAYFVNSLLLSMVSLFFLKFIFKKFFKSEDIKKNKESNKRLNSTDMNGIGIPGNSSLKLETFKIKEHSIFGFIAGWLIVLLVDRNPNDFLYISGLNIALILTGLYLIQAIGIVKYLFVKKNIPAIVVPIAFFIFLLFGIEYFTFVLIVLSGVGIIDFWADFRKLNEVSSANK